MSDDNEPSPTDWVGWVRGQVNQILETGTTDGVTMQNRPIVLLTYCG
jgi:hypothetical protein